MRRVAPARGVGELGERVARFVLKSIKTRKGNATWKTGFTGEI
jgi:hypothetical protein